MLGDKVVATPAFAARVVTPSERNLLRSEQ
jgi:hypothetical protein